ncbi:MAG: DUF971 domain-containing protein [Alphaproteobacteria bacterium]|nr:DUF971 domain-containing protein [Alphaproteobacteria bacterium]MBV9418555.1 DUF971 domain-containing protein [Alphaproteobacteria bacterium]MBV9541149.1 DUF971 domain-containing protein [Alphaproteobacteria bacterium]MBV9903183.1 DUF971 domain-containing protein [Alphaproteobacteria bacterium]
MTEAAKKPWPTEVRVNPARSQVTVEYDTGERFVLPAEYLRVESPSAEVQGHGPSQKQIVTGKSDVKIAGVEPVGNYAVRIRFDDGHDTGLYSWEYLHELGREQRQKWIAYLKAAGKA